jgi:hypothetical protein
VTLGTSAAAVAEAAGGETVCGPPAVLTVGTNEDAAAVAAAGETVWFVTVVVSTAMMLIPWTSPAFVDAPVTVTALVPTVLSIATKPHPLVGDPDPAWKLTVYDDPLPTRVAVPADARTMSVSATVSDAWASVPDAFDGAFVVEWVTVPR